LLTDWSSRVREDNYGLPPARRSKRLTSPLFRARAQVSAV
jgi:hypothetical protein